MTARRLLLVSGPTTGGIKRHLRSLADGLEPAGFRVALAAPPDVRDAAGPAQDFYPLPPAPWAGTKTPRTVAAVEAAIRSHRPDLIHVHGRRAALAARLALRRLRQGIPLVYTVHGYPASAFPGSLQPWLERSLRLPGERYITVSAGLREHVIRFWRLPPERVHLVYNGVAGLPEAGPTGPAAGPDGLRQELGLAGRVPLLGSVGRLVPEKGYDLLLRALALLSPHPQDLRLVLIGDGPSRIVLNNLARQLGVADRVYWLGHREDVPNLLPSLDLYIQPSRREGLGLAVLEAQAAGRPVIATNVGGLRELVRHGLTGWLVPEPSPEQLAAGIGRVLADPVLAGRLAEGGRRQATHAPFTAEAMLAGTVAVYEAAWREGAL